MVSPAPTVLFLVLATLATIPPSFRGQRALHPPPRPPLWALPSTPPWMRTPQGVPSISAPTETIPLASTPAHRCVAKPSAQYRRSIPRRRPATQAPSRGKKTGRTETACASVPHAGPSRGLRHQARQEAPPAEFRDTRVTAATHCSDSRLFDPRLICVLPYPFCALALEPAPEFGHGIAQSALGGFNGDTGDLGDGLERKAGLFPQQKGLTLRMRQLLDQRQ